MAALAKLAKISVKLADKQPAIIYTAIRCSSHEIRHYKPGPLPKTPEERRKAAEKYGIPLSQYETYPDDGMGYGDYPKLPMISAEARDDYYPWDYPLHKKNYNEAFHAENSIMTATRFNVNHKHRYSLRQMWAAFAGTIGFFVLIFFISNQPQYRMYPPALKKQYPTNNTVHYDFPDSKADVQVGHH